MWSPRRSVLGSTSDARGAVTLVCASPVIALRLRNMTTVLPHWADPVVTGERGANNGAMSGSSASSVEELDTDACWRLLSTATLGRIAVVADDGVDIYPVNYLIRDHTLYFSSAPSAKMVSIAAHPRVAFEVDGTTERRRWSVVVRGSAVRLEVDQEIEESGVLGLHSLPPTDKWNYVRIDPDVVTGRRFVSARRRSSLAV
jgi:hypothetical protein